MSGENNFGFLDLDSNEISIIHSYDGTLLLKSHFDRRNLNVKQLIAAAGLFLNVFTVVASFMTLSDSGCTGGGFIIECDSDWSGVRK